MHKPLSYLVYIKSNKKKAVGMIISIALSILMISIMEFYCNNMNDTGDRGVFQYNYYSTLYSTKRNISQEIIDKVNNSDLVEKVINADTHRYMITNIIGADSDYEGYNADIDDIKYLTSKMKLSILKGRLPLAGEKEIIINENVARARNLKIGDYMGSDATSYDWFSGKYKICGIMAGDNIVSFIPKSKEELKKNEWQLLIIPKKGKMSELNKFLNTLSDKKVKPYTIEDVNNSNKNDESNFNMIFNIVIIIIIIVLSVCLGNSAYVHYYQRRMEFGLLAANGYTKKEIILRAFNEIFISCILGLIAGFIITFSFVLMMNKFYLYPHGLTNMYMKADLVLRVISIPLFICIFSLVPTSRLLSKIEPVSIIERNE